MKRVLEFIRSVVPADPFQLCFLFGSILFFICMQLRCIPSLPGLEGGTSSPLALFDDFPEKVRQSWLFFSFSARLPVFFAGAAGLFICFWPGKHPLRRTLILVVLPALSGIIVLCARFLQVSQDLAFPVESVFQRSQQNQAWAIQTLWSMGPALHMIVLGSVLVLIFVSRLAMGIASLPLSLSMANNATLQHENGWKRIQVVIWLGIAGISVFGLIAWSLIQGLYTLLSKVVDYHLLRGSVQSAEALATAMLAGVAAWAVGETRWKDLKKFTRLPEVSFGLLGAALPIGINSLPNIVGYLKDRIHWGKFGPPLGAYFQFPQALFFWYVPAAVFEEIIWRGYLQPRFVRQFGILRGIFLLGLVWSAFHFIGDFQGTNEDYQVFFKLVFRLFSCVVLGYVFGWLTLRSGSIWPAALAHGFHNVWVLSGLQWLGEQDSLWVRYIPWVGWVLLAVALYRFWPPSIVQDVSIESEPDVGEQQPINGTAS